MALACQEAARPKFRSRKKLRSKVAAHYPENLEAEYAYMGWVIDNFDSATKVGKTTAYLNANGTGADVILLKKRINGFYYVAEAAPDTKKKKIFIQSAHKREIWEGARWS